MSLRAFHIVFIGLSFLITLLVGIWLLLFSGVTGMGITLIGGLSALSALVLLVYGIYFFRKSQKLII